MKKLSIIIAVLMLLTACSKNEAPANVQENSIKNESVEITDEVSPAEELGFTVSGEHKTVKFEENAHTVSSFNNENYIFTFCLDGVLKIYSAQDGKLLFSKDYSSFGKLMRMEKYDLKEGYDYRLCFGDRIIYQNSNDFSKSEEVFLPFNTSYNIKRSAFEQGYYDINEDVFVCARLNGIYIYDGVSEEMVASNEIFPTANDFFKKAESEQTYDIQSPVYLSDPRLIENGTKIVIGVFSEIDRKYIGCAVYNIAQQSFEKYIDCPMPQNPVYPIADRYISIPGRQLFDVKTGNSTKIETGNSEYISYDYKTFISYDFVINETVGTFDDFHAFLFDLQTGEKTNYLDLNSGYGLSVAGITDDYLLVDVYTPSKGETYAISYTF